MSTQPATKPAPYRVGDRVTFDGIRGTIVAVDPSRDQVKVKTIAGVTIMGPRNSKLVRV